MFSIKRSRENFMSTKFSFVLIGLLCASAAYASSYRCTGDNGTLQVSVSRKTIKIDGFEQGNSTLQGDLTTYHPRPGHEGSIRYSLTDACDEGTAYAILDKDMAEGKSGKVTIEDACDDDGGSPSFDVYSCELQ
jgi:hypothetical protein